MRYMMRRQVMAGRGRISSDGASECSQQVVLGSSDVSFLHREKVYLQDN